MRRGLGASDPATTFGRKSELNPKLHFIGLLPTMVEATPFPKANLIQVVQYYGSLLIPPTASLQGTSRRRKAGFHGWSS